MVDVLQVIFWTATYVSVIFYGIKYRNPPSLLMPLLAGTLNFAWEVNALIYRFEVLGKLNWGCLVWAILDIAIYILNIRYLIIKSKKHSPIILYVLLLPIVGIVFYALFRLPNFNGQLLTSFLIDLIMAAEFIIYGKRISLHGKFLIGITKLLGDLFAWLYYMRNSIPVMIIGAAVFLLNLFYLAFCLDEMAAAIIPEKKGR